PPPARRTTAPADAPARRPRAATKGRRVRGRHRRRAGAPGARSQRGWAEWRAPARRGYGVQNYATAMESQVANVPEATHTDFKMRDVRYDTGVAAALFNVATLENGR